MPLTDDLTDLLLHLEQAPIPQTHAADDPTVLGRLAELEARGLARTTTDNWVITNQGRTALGARPDGTPRLIVETYRGRSQGGPA